MHTPEWTNLNASDPGVTILKPIAFLTDNLLYRSNRIPRNEPAQVPLHAGHPAAGANPRPRSDRRHQRQGPDGAAAGPAGRHRGSRGGVRFATTTALAVLPVTTQACYQKPQQLDEYTLARYQLKRPLPVDLRAVLADQIQQRAGGVGDVDRPPVPAQVGSNISPNQCRMTGRVAWVRTVE